jgi:drug/metabolite transporter (DMT)-like permease
MNNQLIALFYAALAAVLYAINIPISKILLKDIDPILMASLLYFGAGVGMFIYSLISKREKQSKLTKREMPFTMAMILLDIIAPILLMLGLKITNSSNATLLNNFEIVATSIIALVVFKEFISKKMWLAILLVTLSSALLSFESIEVLKFSWGSILIILACISWGLENNCTRVLSSKSTFQIVVIKGLFSGLGSMVIAIFLQIKFPSFFLIFATLMLGFISYGLSIFFYVKSQSIIGAAKTSAFYSLSPFIGSFLSFIILKEAFSSNYLISLTIMIFGTALIIFDTLAIAHTHNHTHIILNSKEELSHSHIHLHWQNRQNTHEHYHNK